MLREPLIEDGSQKADKYMWLRLIATVVSVSIGSSLQFGFATGSLNNLEQVPLPRVRPRAGARCPAAHARARAESPSASRAQIVPESLAAAGNPINIGLWALINSCFSIGGLLGSYGVVVPLAYLGRKKTLLATNFFVFLSAAFMMLGTTWYVLVLGRICIGIVAGVAQMVAGSYMTEIAPIGIRGSVGVCSQVGIVIGIALANFLTAPAFNTLGSLDRWRYLWLVPCACSCFQLAVLPFCPESPSFLIKAKGSFHAFDTLKKLHREASAAAHMNNLRQELIDGGGGSDDMSMRELLMSTSLRKQVRVG